MSTIDIGSLNGSQNYSGFVDVTASFTKALIYQLNYKAFLKFVILRRYTEDIYVVKN